MGDTGADAGAPSQPAGAIERRAPFSVNPRVGPRGRHTQERILDGALRAFAEVGYHRCRIERIAELAGCSRASFYQYFSGKEDVFHHLAAQVARQVSVSIEGLGLVTADEGGRHTIRQWIGRYAEIYERFAPVFHAYEAAAESAEAIAAVRPRAGDRNVAAIRAKMVVPSTPSRELDAMTGLLLDAAARAFRIAEILRSAAPDACSQSRVEDALADVIHRSLFGLDRDVNAHDPPDTPDPVIAFGAPPGAAAGDEAGEPLASTAARLLEAGRSAFASLGYQATRVDDLVARAGLSHGAFYRHFAGKLDLARVLVRRSVRPLVEVLAALPEDAPAGRAALRRWFERFNAVHAEESPMLRLWLDAAFDEPRLGADTAAALDWTRRLLARFLRGRDFGDAGAEAIVMVALLDGFGARPRSARDLDAIVRITTGGLLGR